MEYATDTLNDNKEDKVYRYEDGNQVMPTDKQLNYKGSKPQDGEVRINKNGKVAIAIHDGKYCAEKSYESSEVKIS